MTKITFYKSGKEYKGFKCSGHADFADEGKDIVCAALSILTINLVNSIETFTDDPFKGEQDEESGLISLMFTGDISKESDLLIKSFELGVTCIKNQYGKKYLDIKYKEV